MDLTPYGLWTVALDLQPAPEARRAAAEIEAMGWGAIWIPEAVNREVMSNSMLLLGATEKLVVATGIANLHARTAMSMGAGHKTVTAAHPDRFLLDARVIGGRSRCAHCGRQLRWFELVPLASFLLQGGRCRGCKPPRRRTRGARG